jgi:hypothetical protein
MIALVAKHNLVENSVKVIITKMDLEIRFQFEMPNFGAKVDLKWESKLKEQFDWRKRVKLANENVHFLDQCQPHDSFHKMSGNFSTNHINIRIWDWEGEQKTLWGKEI